MTQLRNNTNITQEENVSAISESLLSTCCIRYHLKLWGEWPKLEECQAQRSDITVYIHYYHLSMEDVNTGSNRETGHGSIPPEPISYLGKPRIQIQS